MREKRDQIQSIQRLGKTLRLSPGLTTDVLEEGSEEQLAFLEEVLTGAVQAQTRNRHSRLLKKANFPTLKGLDAYCFEGITFPPSMPLEGLKDLRFIETHENLLFYGPVGTGKTHLAIALGREACQRDFKVSFYTVTDLILKMERLQKENALDSFLRSLDRSDLLILDEWGYVPVDQQGSQLLFQVIASSYERRSLILTTNLEFSRWGNIFTDTQMAAAMIDRIIHHGHLFVFSGESYRMKHSLMRA